MYWPWTVPNYDPERLPQAVYSSELIHAKRGTAIYLPEPFGRLGHKDGICLKIGDVGYIRNSLFIPLFRASEPLDKNTVMNHPLRPAGFVPIDVGEVDTGRYSAGIQCSRNVETIVINDPGNSDSLMKEGTVIRFLPKADRVAALMTKYPVWRSDVVAEESFAEYMLKHYKSWDKFCIPIKGKVDLLFALGGPESADLVITDSATKAQMTDDNYREWAYFEPEVPHNAAPFVPMKEDAEADTYLQQLEEQHETLATNSVFIRALRLQCRKILFQETIMAAKHWFAGGSYPVPADVDPLQPIADYIFSHSFAWFALFSDNDIKQLIGDLQPNENLRALLKRLQPRVHVDRNLVGRIDPTFPVPRRWYAPQKFGQTLGRVCSPRKGI
ncbi:hypothetical protein C8R47DRAFT_1206840 [Mycena vitilis]|nr:hypothetical protein C8R47DRAFT_1206840 [Mycena vitilis]